MVDEGGKSCGQHAAFYEIYPHSFAGTHKEGSGDISGIISKLDNLCWLGNGQGSPINLNVQGANSTRESA
jgi:hypothetical protein